MQTANNINYKRWQFYLVGTTVMYCVFVVTAIITRTEVSDSHLLALFYLIYITRTRYAGREIDSRIKH